MKLSIEEKAKAYDEAIKKVNDYYEGKTKLYSDVDKTLEYLFPELKESEDEKMRKGIIKFLIDVNNGAYTKSELEIASWIAWLEKQGNQTDSEEKDNWEYIQEFINKFGHFPKDCDELNVCVDYVLDKIKHYANKEELKNIEQNPIKASYTTIVETGNGGVTAVVERDLSTDNVEPKFKVGDWIINTITKKVEQVIELTDCEYVCSGHLIVSFNNQYLLKKWTIQDAKDGDVLVASDGSIFLFKCVVDAACKYHIAITTDNAVKFNEGLEHYWETSRAVHPATKEQRDLLFLNMKEAGYEFDTERKEMKKIEQNQENAGITIEDIEESLLAYKIIVMDNEPELANYIEEEISWLKSLKKKRYIWKPNNKQLEALKDAIYTTFFENPSDSSLLELYEQLKKLKEE